MPEGERSSVKLARNLFQRHNAWCAAAVPAVELSRCYRRGRYGPEHPVLHKPRRAATRLRDEWRRAAACHVGELADASRASVAQSRLAPMARCLHPALQGVAPRFTRLRALGP